MKMRFRFCLALLSCLLCSCAQDVSIYVAQAEGGAEADAAALPASDAGEVWQPLQQRLQDDGLDAAELALLFARLDPVPSSRPMGLKIKELYTSKFIPRPKPAQTPTKQPSWRGIPRPWYKGVVTEANARLCRNYIQTHASAFRSAADASGVPREVAAALLFVETRLGSNLGGDNAFRTLADMSVSRQPGDIADWFPKLPGVENHMDWVRERMAVKAEWAYAELHALLSYCSANQLDPFTMPGSIYGAVGICQFMPSNLVLYAADGDGDGKADVFVPADAVASLSNYLVRHGWKKKGMNISQQIRVLRRYNNSATYANTILALAERIRLLDKPAKAKTGSKGAL